MKLICDGLDLSDALLKVSKALSVKKTNPILECIKLSAKGDTLTLLATDKELTIEKSIKADVIMEGATVVPGKIFVELVKKLENEKIELYEIEDKELYIRYSDSETKVQTFSAEEYPVINKNIEDMSITISQNDFRQLITRTVFACSIDDDRRTLKGCLLDVKDNYVTSVATDGFKLALAKCRVTSYTGDFKAIVPARALNEIIKSFDKNNEEIKIVFNKTNLMVEVDSTVFISLLLEGDFIPYRQIIPQEFLINARVNKKMLLSSLERASILNRNDILSLVKLDFKDKTLNVTSASEIGNLNESIIINMDGRDILIAVNSKYLSEILRTIDDEFINMNFNSSISPCVIKPVEGDDYLYLILPIRINA